MVRIHTDKSASVDSWSLLQALGKAPALGVVSGVAKHTGAGVPAKVSSRSCRKSMSAAASGGKSSTLAAGLIITGVRSAHAAKGVPMLPAGASTPMGVLEAYNTSTQKVSPADPERQKKQHDKEEDS